MMAAQETREECARENSIPSSEGERPLEARFECPICLHCLSEPVLTSCGHRFCKSCIHMWLQREGAVCPVDNQPLNPDTDLFPDNFTRREIQELDSKNQDGQNSGSHLVECSFREVGCLATLHRQELTAHLETEIQHHIALLSAAYSKLRLTVQEQKMEAKEQEATSLWQPDCKGQAHQNGDAQPWQALVRSLYERIVMLEQRNQEQDIKLDNMKRQLSTDIEVISQDLALQYCNGTYLWTVAKISNKLSAMADNPKRCMFYSSGFYTAPNGYRFCARINLSPSDHSYLALLIHVMRTDHDSSLAWPFTGRITFMLVNAKDPSRHICETMMSRPELDAFKRPMKDMNPRGFGYTEFISVFDLNDQGFVNSDDSILIKLHILSV